MINFNRHFVCFLLQLLQIISITQIMQGNLIPLSCGRINMVLTSKPLDNPIGVRLIHSLLSVLGIGFSVYAYIVKSPYSFRSLSAVQPLQQKLSCKMRYIELHNLKTLGEKFVRQFFWTRRKLLIKCDTEILNKN